MPWDWQSQTGEEFPPQAQVEGTASPVVAIVATGLLNRIQISSASNGPCNYQLGLNPVYYDPVDYPNIVELKVLHGAPIHQKFTDFRIRTLQWENVTHDNTLFDSFIAYLRSIKGQIRYFNFKTLDDINDRWPSSNTWKKARIVDLQIQYKPGGKLYYDSVKLLIQPES